MRGGGEEEGGARGSLSKIGLGLMELVMLGVAKPGSMFAGLRVLRAVREKEWANFGSSKTQKIDRELVLMR